MAVERVEIYTAKPDNSEGGMVYPERGEGVGRRQVRELLDAAQIRGLYFSGPDGEGYFISNHDGPSDQPLEIAERIYLEPGEHFKPEGYERVARRVAELRPNQDIKVVIF